MLQDHIADAATHRLRVESRLGTVRAAQKWLVSEVVRTPDAQSRVHQNVRAQNPPGLQDQLLGIGRSGTDHATVQSRVVELLRQLSNTRQVPGQSIQRVFPVDFSSERQLELGQRDCVFDQFRAPLPFPLEFLNLFGGSHIEILHGGSRSTGATDPEVSGPQSPDLLGGPLESGGF